VASAFLAYKERKKTKERTLLLVALILLLGMAMIPAVPEGASDRFVVEDAASQADMPAARTMKIPVTHDVSVVNGSYADSNMNADPQLHVGTGYDGTWVTGRSWFRFDLTHLGQEMTVQAASLNVYLTDEWVDENEPVGAYYCANDSWDTTTITWNNQPDFSGVYSDVIDSPASPDMFVPLNWYSWEVTEDVRATLSTDKVLTEVLKQTEELGTINAFLYPERITTSRFYGAYLEINYTTPTTEGLTVEGISSGPLLDYIQNPCPELGWSVDDPDYQDFVKDYEVEVWNDSLYNDTLLWQSSHEAVYWVHNSFGISPPGNSHPFGRADEFRMQMKYTSSALGRSGIVDKLYFISAYETGFMQVQDLEISLVGVPGSADLTADMEANLEGRTPTVVLSTEIFETNVKDYVIEIDVEDTFFLNEHLSLVIDIRLMNNTGDIIRLNRTATAGPSNVAYSYGDGMRDTTTANLVYDRTYDLRVGFLTKSISEAPTWGSFNAFPFGVTEGTSGRFQLKYNQSFIGRSGYIDRAYFKVSDIDDNTYFENLTISLVETPVLGPLSHVDMDSNYGGVLPMVVLDEDMYTVTNLGHAVAIDFDLMFYYSGTHDLLIDFKWDARTGPAVLINRQSGTTSSYRAWDLHWAGEPRIGNETAGYDFLLDIVPSEESVPLEGCITLENATRYYWRVRTCDSTGVWGEWATANFKYEVLTSGPTFSAPVVDPEPAYAGQEVTVSISATYFLGMEGVLLEFGGMNHTMTPSGDTFSYSWTPAVAGNVSYTIYMESAIGTYSTTSGELEVLESTETTGTGTGTGPGPGFDPTILIVAGAAAVVAVVIVIIILKRKPSK
jgi:hypothetical protein